MREWRAATVVVVTGLVVGGLTSLLQSALPFQAASLANSAGPWCAVAFLLARLGRTVGGAALLGAAALVSLDLGYYATAAARGFPTSSAHITFWIVAGLAVGPVLGVGARWLDARHPVRRALGVAVLPIVLVLEGLRSLAQVGHDVPAVLGRGSAGRSAGGCRARRADAGPTAREASPVCSLRAKAPFLRNT